MLSCLKLFPLAMEAGGGALVPAVGRPLMIGLRGAGNGQHQGALSSGKRRMNSLISHLLLYKRKALGANLQ